MKEASHRPIPHVKTAAMNTVIQTGAGLRLPSTLTSTKF